MPTKQPLILIVDDDASLRDIAAEILTQAGYNTIRANNVKEGIAQLEQFQPDLVLSDVMMPDGTGFEILDAVQKKSDLLIPFIMMSGEAILADDIRKGMRSGADDYLIKPFKAQDLLESIHMRLYRQQQFQKVLNQYQAESDLPACLQGSEADLLARIKESSPHCLIALEIDQYERFQRTLGRVGADILCRMFYQRLREHPNLNQFDFYASEKPYQIFLCSNQSVPSQEIIESGLNSVSEEPITYEPYQLHLHISLGWVFQEPQQIWPASQWLEYAHLALYQSRLQGGASSTRYHPLLEKKLHERLHWEDELQLALQENRFELFFQPQMDLQNNQVISVESLVRLKHPEFGIIAPGDFIQIAEDSGLIIPIGTWILKQACQTLLKLHRLGHHQIRMAVNVSLLQFQAANFTRLVADTFEETGTLGSFIELELTESLLISNFKQVKAILDQLKTFGLTLAVDDFGTGYSSLYYLNQLPFDTLKIDQSFVRQIHTNSQTSLAIPKAIIEMGHSLGMKVLAEGIETQEQFDALRHLGCDYGQGFLFSRPVPEAELELFLARQAQ